MNHARPTPIGVRLSDMTFDRPGLFSTEVPTSVRDEKTPTASFKPGAHERANMALEEFISRMREVTTRELRATHVAPETIKPNDTVSEQWLSDSSEAVKTAKREIVSAFVRWKQGL